MKRHLIATALILSLGVLLGAIASPKSLSPAATSLFTDAGVAANTSGPANVPAPGAPDAQTSTVNGSQSGDAPGAVNPLRLDLQVEGALSGKLVVTIDHNNSHEIVGGHWELKVMSPTGDGTPAEAGALKGSFTGGAVAMNEDGTVAGVNAAKLSVEGGTGNYSAIAAGTGTLAGVFTHANTPPFSGSLALEF